MKDLARAREVQADRTESHSLVMHALEGMVEGYLGLNESVREMVKFITMEIREQEKDNQFSDQRQANRHAAAAANGNGYGHTNGDAPVAGNGTGSTTAAADGSAPQGALSAESHTNGEGKPVDTLAADGKRALGTKRMAELAQDHAALQSVKRHCVKTLRALRNVHVLVSGVDALRDIIADKEFHSARLAFAAITDLFATLTAYSRLPVLRSLNGHVECYKAALRKEIFSAFREHLGASYLAAPSNTGAKAAKIVSLSRLHHCARLIDLLYSSVERKELVKWFVAVQIQSYNQLVARRTFGDVLTPTLGANGQPTGFELLDKQLAWVWSELKSMWDDEYVQVFPSQWYVDALFVRKYFEILRLQVSTTLEAQEQRIKDENETRRALTEAKKARAIMMEMNRMQHSGSSTNLSGQRSGGAGNAAAAANGRAKPATDPAAPQRPNGASDSPPASRPGLAHSSSFSGSSPDAGSTIDGDDKPLQFDFYKPLLRTIEFENQMRARWLNEHSDVNLTEDDLFVVLGTVENPALGGDPALAKNPPPYPFQFAGYISSAFHPYLPHMLRSERTRFYNFLEALDEEEQWEVESAEISTCHFSAATKLFVMIQKSMERYSKVMPGDCFLDLFKEYRAAISNYLELLSKHLPTARALEEEEVQSICATINTCDYILDRCTSLANTVIQMLTGHSPDSTDDLTEEQQSFLGVLREHVDWTSVEEQVSHLTHRSTHALAGNIVRRLEPSLAHMKDNKSGATANGGAGAAVSDENKYVREIIATLKQQLTDKAKMSSFAYLSQVVAQDFLRFYYASLRSCRFKITESVAQQMLLDLQSIKSFLLRGIPDLKVRATRAAIVKPGQAELGDEGRSATAESSQDAAGEPALPAAFKPFVKLVNAQTQPSENLLKALTSPNARLISTYKIIFPKADPKSVFELLSLRGISSSDQEKMIRAYNASVKTPAEQLPIIKKDFFGNISQMVRDTTRRLCTYNKDGEWLCDAQLAYQC